MPRNSSNLTPQKMKIRLFTIPNILTLSNLACGSIALIEILLYQNFVSAFILIIAAAAFDFLDGMSARLLNQYSKLGVELDSLADIISFGVVPSMAMFTLFNISPKGIDCQTWSMYGAYITLLIGCFSALRLARFNIDDEQKESFIGLPTPANALFCLSLSLLVSMGKLTLSAECVAITSVVMALLLISPLKLFALKFKEFSWTKNKVRYIFLILAAATLVICKEYALPVIVAIYILTSIASNIIESAKTK